ncbi:MAG: YolD-like family protein [Bacilli bacterium]|nr:YolD-like family protein [Bacilli bacterium]
MNNKIHDRGMIKWQPFDSLTNTKQMKHKLELEKQKVSMPILSDDQLQLIENNIKESYYSKSYIKIYYYFNGTILNKKCKIKFIDYPKKQITISDNTIIYYKQIVEVKII